MFDQQTDAGPLVRALAGRAFADPFPWRFLTRVAEIPDRLGGSRGERRAADLAREALPGTPTLQSFPIERWTRGRADLTVAVDRPDGSVERSFEAVALPYSPSGTVEAPLVDAGHGTEREIRDASLDGAIAVARTDSPETERFVHRMETYGHAVEAGAEAFLFVNHVPGQLPPTGSLRFGSDASVPGVGVSRETGGWLTDYAAGGDGAGAIARLDVEATTERAESRNVVTHLGPDTDERVVLVAHLDAHDIAEGALDNGAGLTVAVTAARLLATVDADPDAPDPGLERGVTVAAVGCEETGLLGSEALAERLDAELDGGLDAVHAVCNVDGAGRARDLRAYTHGSDAVERLAGAVTGDAGVPLHLERTPHPYSDHWPFLRAGVPALQLHSRPPTGSEGPGGGPRGRGYTHTRADTRDKVDRRDLRTHAVWTALVVRELTRRDLPCRDPAEVAVELRDAGAEPGMRAAGVWPDGWD
ncbi:M28 family peptidase [Haloglomus litoreum]|uniref:M28 family peptidase n=1 Tax=Haloglomus litoreum TaxID=3034026 RepID=UPI0023E87060|nr:M28 family peptidase [Haloglomus sp. DT116]